MSSERTGRRLRSPQAEVARAKKDILRKVNQGEALARINDHQAGLHAKPWRHQDHCYACLARVRWDHKEEDRR